MPCDVTESYKMVDKERDSVAIRPLSFESRLFFFAMFLVDISHARYECIFLCLKLSFGEFVSN